MSETTALAGWFGSNRMLAHKVGEALKGCKWVGVPFAGGMSELPHIKARTILVNDLHRHVINLARVAADDVLRVELVRRLEAKAFHPDQLKESQENCSRLEPMASTPTWAAPPDLALAEHYFVCCWMGRASKAGGKDEFDGRTATRWNAAGGDSVVRYHSAIRALELFSSVLKRCTFETMDAVDFLARCEDREGHGVYCDPPFPGAGRKYKHNAGQTEAEELAWHGRLAAAVSRFEKTRVVMRFYDHPMVRELYPVGPWRWLESKGRTQANAEAAEVLLVRNGPDLGSLFGGGE